MYQPANHSEQTFMLYNLNVTFSFVYKTMKGL